MQEIKVVLKVKIVRADMDGIWEVVGPINRTKQLGALILIHTQGQKKRT